MTEPVVEQYLNRLRTAALVLPPDQQAELVDGISAHISEAYESGAVTDEAGLRSLLDRLGEPEDIVASAREDLSGFPGGSGPGTPGWPHGPGAGWAPALQPPGTGRESTAVLLMTVGSIIPLVGWLIGVALLWTSTRWRAWEKLLATLIFPGGPFFALFLGLISTGSGSESCTSSSSQAAGGPVINTPEVCTSSSSGFSLPIGLGLPLLAAWFVLPLIIGFTLLGRARRRAALEPWVPGPPPTSGTWGAVEVAAVALVGIGSFLAPFVGPLAGLIFVWLSRAWTRSEKINATALTTGPLLIGLAALVYVGLSTMF